MTEFRGIKVVAVPLGRGDCVGCLFQAEPFDSEPCNSCDLDELNIYKPASLHDGKHVHVVLTGGRKPSFPIKAVWFRDGRKDSDADWWMDFEEVWPIHKEPNDIIAVERAKEGV